MSEIKPKVTKKRKPKKYTVLYIEGLKEVGFALSELIHTVKVDQALRQDVAYLLKRDRELRDLFIELKKEKEEVPS